MKILSELKILIFQEGETSTYPAHGFRTANHPQKLSPEKPELREEKEALRPNVAQNSQH